jgi:hypothetical protein
MTNWTTSKTSTLCFKEIRCHQDVGMLGNGFPPKLNSDSDMITSFSFWSGLNIGAERALLRSKGTSSIPSSMSRIKRFPEFKAEVLLERVLSWFTGNAVYMLGNGWMLLIDLRGKPIGPARTVIL